MKFDKIVEDIGNAWQEAIPNGIINKNNPYHVVILEGVLDKFNLTREQKLRMLNSIRGIKEGGDEYTGIKGNPPKGKYDLSRSKIAKAANNTKKLFSDFVLR